MKTTKSDSSYDLLFFGAFGLFLFYTVLSTGLYYDVFRGLPFNLMYVIVMGMLAGYEVLRRNFGKQDLFWGGAAFVLFAVSFRVTSGNLQRSIPCIFMFVFCARNISFDRIARFAMIWTSILAGFVVFSGYVGLVDNHVVVLGGRVREYMGFRYALFPSAHLLNITTLWLWLNRKKVPVFGVLVLTALNIWVYVKTDSRFSFVFSILLLTAALALRFFPGIFDKVKFLRWIMAGSFHISSAASLLLTACYHPSIGWMESLNKALGYRLSLGHRALVKFGTPLFGMTVDWVGNGLNAAGQQPVGAYDYVDCIYVNNMINFGPVFTVICLIAVTLALIAACRKRMDLGLIIFSTIALHLILDDLSLYLYYNPFWILLGQFLMNPDIVKPEPEPHTKRLDSGKLWKKLPSFRS